MLDDSSTPDEEMVPQAVFLPIQTCASTMRRTTESVTQRMEHERLPICVDEIRDGGCTAYKTHYNCTEPNHAAKREYDDRLAFVLAHVVAGHLFIGSIPMDKHAQKEVRTLRTEGQLRNSRSGERS